MKQAGPPLVLVAAEVFEQPVNCNQMGQVALLRMRHIVDAEPGEVIDEVLDFAGHSADSCEEAFQKMYAGHSSWADPSPWKPERREPVRRTAFAVSGSYD